MWFRKPKIAEQVQHELYICERMLLEAEGRLENAQGAVDVLTKRRQRLLGRTTPAALDVRSLNKALAGLDEATHAADAADERLPPGIRSVAAKLRGVLT